MLSTSQISYSIGKKKILDEVSAEFYPGEFNMMLGPNGSGKTTFLKIFSGDIAGYTGMVFYDDKNIHNLKKTVLAKHRAVMSQHPDLNFPLAVEEVVLMGRYPHFEFSPGKKDLVICEEVIRRLNLGSFRERNYLTLSGGERQRVHFARVLAQIWEEPENGYRYLILDEPLTSLDINYQQEFLQIAKEFLGERTVLIAILHDINLAIQYADRIFFLKDGELLAQGKPAAVLTEPLLEKVFGISTTIVPNPVTGAPLVIYSRNTNIPD